MSITLTGRHLSELKKAVNTPHVVIEVELDSGVARFGFYALGGLSVAYFLANGEYVADGSVFAIGMEDLAWCDIKPVLKSVSSLQNKLDPKSGYSTRGTLTFVIAGRENFKNLIAGNYLKNRRVTRKDGFLAHGFTYLDYAATFSGKISDWSRKGDELTVTVSDDLVDASQKIPVENAAKTQYLEYRNMNPVDIITDILAAQLGIDTPYINAAQFSLERDNWLNGWKFDRVITEPKAANEYLNELQQESNSFLLHDGSQVSFKSFSPPVPGQSIEEWTDNCHILNGSFSQKSGYKDNFFNRVVVYYDYDESGGDSTDNYESAVIAVDAASQDPSQWNEASTKVIKSRWIRGRTDSQTTYIGGVKVYHVSRNNGTGTGTMTFNKANNTLQWTAPGDSTGEAVKLSKDGKFQLYSADRTKYVRVLATVANLPTGDANDTVAIYTLGGDVFASVLAQKLLNRYRDPVATATLQIDINNAAWGSEFIKPTDLKDITTDEACGKGTNAWNRERVMVTSVRPDPAAQRVDIECIQTRIYRRYGFIAPAGQPDYPTATAAQRERAYIGDLNNKVNAGSIDGYYIW